MRIIAFFVGIAFLAMQAGGCTPLVIGGAAAGGAYAGYKAREKGYSINITKEAKGTKHKSSTVTKDNSSKTDE